MHYHSKEKEYDTLRKQWTNLRAKTSKANSSPVVPCLISKGWAAQPFLLLLLATHFSPLGWLHSLYAALLDRPPQLWHCQYPGVSNTVQDSFHSLKRGASSGLHIGTPLPHTWPHRLFLAVEEIQTPWVSFRTQDRTTQQMLPSWLPAWDGAWTSPWIT